MRTWGGKGSATKLLGGSYPSSAKILLQQRHWQSSRAPVLLAVHRAKWHIRRCLPAGLGRSAGGKTLLISSDCSQGLCRRNSQSLEIEREKTDEFSALQLNYQQGAMHVVGVFASRRWNLSPLISVSELPILNISQARKGYLSWQHWKSSTIWCLCACRGSTEGFSVTDEICSPSNMPVKVILPLESQTVRFLSKRCSIPGN